MNSTIAPGLPILTVVGLILMAAAPPLGMIVIAGGIASQCMFRRRVRELREEAHVRALEKRRREQFAAIGVINR